MVTQDADTSHKLRGLIILLSTDPSIDGQRKITVFFAPVFIPCYVDKDWWILYEVKTREDGEEELMIFAIGPRGTTPSLRP